MGNSLEGCCADDAGYTHPPPRAAMKALSMPLRAPQQRPLCPACRATAAYIARTLTPTHAMPLVQTLRDRAGPTARLYSGRALPDY